MERPVASWELIMWIFSSSFDSRRLNQTKSEMPAEILLVMLEYVDIIFFFLQGSK